MNQTASQTALRRLLLIIAFAVGVVIFSYGWTVTDINLNRPQEAIRQQNAGNALRDLLSPRVFVQDYDIQAATTPFRMNCPADGGEPTFEESPAPAEGQPYVVITPTCARSDDLVTVQGYNFYPNSLARINWIAEDGERRIRQVVGRNENNFITNADGTFNVQIEVPRIRGTAGQTHTIEAQGTFPAGLPRFSDTTALVLEKMVETVFLALIATALSILPSAILSFFAAHNLMRPIKMPVGSLLVSFILLFVGGWIGTQVLSQLGQFALNLGSGRGIGVGGVSAAALMLVGTVVSSRMQPSETNLIGQRMRTSLNTILVVVIFIFLVGLIGGLGILFGEQFDEGIPGHLSNMIGSLGQLVELTLPLIAGVVGAFGLSALGGAWTKDVLKRLDVTTAHIAGGLLGAVCGALLMAIIGNIGMQAAWLGLLPPLIAASIGGGILPAIYNRLNPVSVENAASTRAIRQLISWVGAALVFVFTFSVLNVGRALIEGTLPPHDNAVNLLGISLSSYVFQSMLIGAVLGAMTGALAGTKANFPLGEILYNTTRTILNTLRSIEPLIMGLVFVIWVGIGPFAGVLALTLHSIASLGKLYSEQIENIDGGPIEAIQSTGANRLQMIMYAVVPQIIPPYIAFTMYRWDINVRMSTIIGFVGGGGVGFLLQQQINLLRYRDAGVAVLAIAIVVSILDYASASIRERVM
jgi:phosphonate ABC transporter permease subunit PhnE